jgi:hypothetical protein
MARKFIGISLNYDDKLCRLSSRIIEFSFSGIYGWCHRLTLTFGEGAAGKRGAVHENMQFGNAMTVAKRKIK